MQVKYLVISDIHLGHNNTPTEHIINNLKTELLVDNKKDLDILFIAGDFFDKLLDFNSNDVHCIIVFIHQLLIFCSINNIKLRVLEGTPSHDWKQSKIFIKINEVLKQPADLRYITVLSIEHIKDLEMYVLYIPDEWSNDPNVIESDINKALNEYSIKQVDIAIMHGHFKYQALGMPTHSIKYDEVYFLNLVKYYISIGHFHTHSHYERIVAQGSFDRLAHNEEEDKGYAIINIDTNTNIANWVFHKNSNAYTYKSIKVTNNTDINKLDKIISLLPKRSFVRLVMNKDHSLNANFEELKLRYIEYNLKRNINDSNKQSEISVIAYIDNDTDFNMDNYVLNEGNIKDRLKESIVNKGYTFADSHWKLFDSFFERLTT